MLEQVLIALASGGGTAVVTAAGTDAWSTVRYRVAGWLGRGDRDRERLERELLDDTAVVLRRADPASAGQERIRQEAAWAARFRELLEGLPPGDRERAAAEFRSLIDLGPTCHRQPADGVQRESGGTPSLRRTGSVIGGEARHPVPRELPAAPAGFIDGNDATLDVAAHLGTQGTETTPAALRIVTISGMGGVGKTWLALHWAHSCADDFPDGQLFADLRGFDPTEPPVLSAAVLRRFLNALGVHPAALPDSSEAQRALFRTLTADRKILILLDNAHDSSQVIPLLPGSPHCAVIVTSRNRLTDLALRYGAQRLELGPVTAAHGERMIAEALGRDRIAFEHLAVERIVDHCGGLPLAISIMIGRARSHPSFPLRALADETSVEAGRLDALEDDDVGLRAVLAGSYRALPEPAARFFRLLGMVAGPDISLMAASRLTGETVSRCRQLLRSLEGVNLLEEHRSGRYRMHDLVRLYAAELAGDEASALQQERALRQLVDHYERTACAAAQALAPHRPPLMFPLDTDEGSQMSDISTALAWFDNEHLCVLAAQRTAVRYAWHKSVWQLTWALNGYYWRRGNLTENLMAWRSGLAAAGILAEPAVQALSHLRYGQLCERMGRHEEADRHLRHALILAEHRDDPPSEAGIHRALAFVLGSEDRCGEALRHAETALELYQSACDLAGESEALGAVAWFHARLDHVDEARSYCERALAMSRRTGYRVGEATAVGTFAFIDWITGNLATALAICHQALVLYREIEDRYWEAELLDGMASISHGLGRDGEALDFWQQALAMYHDQLRTSHVHRVEQCLAQLGEAENAG